MKFPLMLRKTHEEEINRATNIIVEKNRVIAVKNDEKGIYVTGYANNALDFTKNATTKTKFVKTQEDKKILSVGMTRSGSTQTSAIIDETGKIWTVGNNAYGQMGNGTTESLRKPWCIQDNKIDISKNNTINLQVQGDKKQIQYSEILGFNVLTNNPLTPSNILGSI